MRIGNVENPYGVAGKETVISNESPLAVFHRTLPGESLVTKWCGGEIAAELSPLNSDPFLHTFIGRACNRRKTTSLFRQISPTIFAGLVSVSTSRGAKTFPPPLFESKIGGKRLSKRSG